MRGLKKVLGLGMALALAGCNHPPPVEINVDQAKAFADKVALDFFDNNGQSLYPKLDQGFKFKVHDAKDLQKVLDHVRFLYGKPASYDFKVATYGNHATESGPKPYVVLWYILKTDRYPKGDHYLKIEVVQAEGATFLDLGGIGVLDFPDGLPAYLK
ncbi:MAG TPA: hypothetical protein VMU88_07055 [bacterium]|nr:hypothetical protein [bacterium]